MTEGFITRWLLKEGDSVKAGEPLFEMETDKLVITIDATCSGKLLKILYPEGSTVPITTVIAYVGEEGDVVPEGAPELAPAAAPVPDRNASRRRSVSFASACAPALWSSASTTRK